MTDLILCQCAHYGLIPQETLRVLTASLQASGVPFKLVADLCELAAHKDPRLLEFANAPRPTVVACHPRAIIALFQLAGAPLDIARMLLVNARDGSLTNALAALDVPQHAPEATIDASPAPSSADGWIPWFPVIDAARCTNCQQCLGFCLFGVYGLSPEGRVQVENPQGCKTNCPACARICPEVAIIFPKYGESPINGGPIVDEAQQKERIKVDLEAVLGSDVYAKLAERRSNVEQKRLLRQNVELANAERQRFLAASAPATAQGQSSPIASATPPGFGVRQPSAALDESGALAKRQRTGAVQDAVAPGQAELDSSGHSSLADGKHSDSAT